MRRLRLQNTRRQYTWGTTLRERTSLILKCGAFIVAAFMVFSGKPPSHAQTITTPPDSIQAAEQNMAIGANAAKVEDVRLATEKLAVDVVELKTQQASTDSKLTIFGGLVLVLQGSGIVLSLGKRKREE